MLTKVVDGVVVECSQEEAAHLKAEWEKNDPEKNPLVVVDPVQKLRDFLASNPDVAAVLK